MTIYDATRARLQLLANGYVPTPNLDKRCMLKGWASQDYPLSLITDTITLWDKAYRHFRATGVLVRNGLMPIDLDIADQAMSDAVLDKLIEINPAVYNAPWRTGKPPKLMVFAQWQRSNKYPSMFKREASAKFTDAAGKTHQIEVFGGAPSSSGGSSKQVGVFGPHSYVTDEAGEIIKPWRVAREYSWEDDFSLLDVPLKELPTMTQDQVWELLAAFEELAKAAGWVEQTPPKTAGGQFVYDITPATEFEPEHGEVCVYADLDEGMRVSGSFIDGSNRRRDKCLVLYCKVRGVLGVFDYENNSWHLPEEAAPLGVDTQTEQFREQLERLTTEGASITPELMPQKPADDAGLAAQAAWLLQTYAYCPPNHSVVELFQPSDACEMRVQAHQTKYLAWREETEGPRGGKHVALATAAWLIHPKRPTIRGVRMRPDQNYPLYEEMGEIYKNTYRRPLHSGEGEVSTFLTFMEHLLPVPAEREWFLSWMAHKNCNPDIPGVAVIMVAAAGADGPVFGAGRGLLRDILARLLGPRYVTTIDFDVFAGRSAQGVYTDWAAYATLVTVAESKDTPESGRWTAQRAVYERIKEMVDPRAVERTFQRKGLPAFRAMCFASYLIFSNNRDALQIPTGDRRVTALQNGRQLPENQAEMLQQWMDEPGNIAALARFLEARDTADFSPYVPLRTSTKDVMQQLARSELDDAYTMVRRRIGLQRLFTGEQVRAAVMNELGDVMVSELLRNQVTRKVRADATQVLDYRLTRTLGGHKILAWRDSPLAAGGREPTREQAQTMVGKTSELLSSTGSVVLQMPVVGSVVIKKDEGKQEDE